MNRWVVSSRVLTQSYFISLYLLNTLLPLIHPSICPNGQGDPASPHGFPRSRTPVWTDGQIDEKTEAVSMH